MDNEVSTFNNIEYSSLVPPIAYLFIMNDGRLFSLIREAERNGFATKSEIHSLFRVKKFIFDTRIQISHDEELRIYYNQLVDSMAERFPIANPKFLTATKKDENGEIVDCGLVSAVRKLSSRGMTKQIICEQLEINPASFAEFPVLLTAYEGGLHEFKNRKSDEIIDGITANFITNNYFVETVIPAIQQEAFEHKVWLTKRRYKIEIDEKTGKAEKILKSEEQEEKLVQGNKEMRELAIRLSSGDLIDKVGMTNNKREEALKKIPMHRSAELISEQGNAEIPEDAEYESVD